MYRFLVTPKWMFGHVLLVVLVAIFIWAGFWQLSRLAEARSERMLGENRVEAPAVPLTEAGGNPEELVYRRVEVSGSYLHQREVTTAPRSRDGRPGYVLLTPLQPADGGAPVLVERGWVPFSREGVPPERAAPPEGEVTVTGVLLPAENAASQPVFNDAGFVRFIDPPALEDDLGVDLQPLALRLLEQQPAQTGDLPVAGRVPQFDEGNHLSYAVQWFSFAAIALIGYPILVRRTARDRMAAGELVGSTGGRAHRP